MEEYNKQFSVIEEIPEDLEEKLLPKDSEFCEINKLYDECLTYLKQESMNDAEEDHDPDYESIKDKSGSNDENDRDDTYENEYKDENHHNGYKDEEVNEIESKTVYKIENELISNESINTVTSEPRSERLRKLSQQLPKIIITQSNTSLNIRKQEETIGNKYFKKQDVKINEYNSLPKINQQHEFKHNNVKSEGNIYNKVKSTGKHYNKADVKKMIVNGKKPVIIEKECKLPPRRPGQEYPKRLVSKRGVENVALISNVPFERIRLLNDTFHTLINLRWRWIVTGTIVVHFTIWLVFAVFWYITALAHYDFDPNPPKKTCVTGGHDFLTIFLASVEAQTTIGFGDRAIDEECPESIFLFIMQLILGTGLSGVLTCVVYAKLTRPEKLSRDGVGFSKKAVISARDGRLCLMMRAWDLNYDHIISSEFKAHFVHTHRTKEGEVIRYYAQTLALQQRQFLLWPVTLLHVIDHTSPLYGYGPDLIANNNYEITVSLKGASASMGTFTQSQTSYLPKEVAWGHRFPPVVKYDSRKQKYVIDHKKLDAIEPVDTPCCSAEELVCGPIKRKKVEKMEYPVCPGTPASFSDRISSFHLERSSSFRRNNAKNT